MSECPVCYHPLEIHTECIDVYNGMGPTCEEIAECSNKCYRYDYHYGVTSVYVQINGHTLVFGWSYSDEDSVMRSESDAIDLAVKAAQHAQFEDYWRLVYERSATASVN